MLKYALLGFLHHRDMTGYELEQFFEGTMHFWRAKLSQIYRTLKQMEEQGLVISRIEKQDSRPDKRVYTITEAGEGELEKWQTRLVTELDPIKQPTLLKLFFAGGASKEQLLTQLRIMLDLYRQQHVFFRDELPDQIEMLKAILPHDDNDALIWDSIRHLGEMYMETYVRWLEETIPEIEKKME